MAWEAWLLFASTETVLCVTPGPAVLFVLSHGLAAGGRVSLWANAGILAANAAYFLLSAAGLGAALLAWPALFVAIKYAGAAYLVYLGVGAWRRRAPAPGAAVAPRHDRSSWRTLARGFALQAANPKALAFFTAFLPQFIDTSRPIGTQIAILAATSIVIEFAVLAGYGYLAASAAAVTRRPSFAGAINRVSGVLLIAAGAGVALASAW